MRGARHVLLGAGSGVVTMLVFTAAHDLLIVDIWAMVGPMVVAGALCGAGLVWGYRAAGTDRTARRWWAYLGVCTALLIALGPASVLTLESRWTMAEMMDNEEAFELLLPPTLPLLAAATVIGTVVLWLWLGRRPRAVVPLLLTQALLVFFAGHQLAFLGLVESSTATLVALAEFAGFVLLLAGLYGVGVQAGEAVLDRVGDAPRVSPPR